MSAGRFVRSGVAASLVAIACALPSQASASPLGDAKARADALRAAVDKLDQQVEMAAEKYDAAETALGQAVTGRLLAQQQLDAMRQQAAASSSGTDDTARAVYEMGGEGALYATVLDGSSPADFVDRVRTIRSLVSGELAGANDAGKYVTEAAAIEKRLHSLERHQLKLAKAAQDQAATVRGLLAKEQSMLAAADANVRQIADAERRAAQAAAERAFAAQLAAARAAAGLSPGTDVTPSAVADAAVAAARTQLGKPYQWGAVGPDSFDCSGLTQWAYAQAGVQLPRTAAEQWSVGMHPDLAHLAPGDLLFWAYNATDMSTIHHVAIYVGGGMMIAAPHTGTNVQIEPVYADGFVGATRPDTTTTTSQSH